MKNECVGERGVGSLGKELLWKEIDMQDLAKIIVKGWARFRSQASTQSL